MNPIDLTLIITIGLYALRCSRRHLMAQYIALLTTAVALGAGFLYAEPVANWMHSHWETGQHLSHRVEEHLNQAILVYGSQAPIPDDRALSSILFSDFPPPLTQHLSDYLDYPITAMDLNNPLQTHHIFSSLGSMLSNLLSFGLIAVFVRIAAGTLVRSFDNKMQLLPSPEKTGGLLPLLLGTVECLMLCAILVGIMMPLVVIFNIAPVADHVLHSWFVNRILPVFYALRPGLLGL